MPSDPLPDQSNVHWYCEVCGVFDGPKSDNVCDVCHGCADDGVRYSVVYMAPARDDERGKLFELRNLLTGPGDPASLVADALYYLAAPTAETDALVAAIHRYLQVDGSYEFFHALERAKARDELVRLVGEPQRLTLHDIVTSDDEPS